MKPWEESGAWKTKASYFSWLRGQMRRIWAKYPVRNDFKKGRLRAVTAKERSDKLYHPSTRKVGMCDLCQGWFPASKLEVDHLTPSEGCTNEKEAEAFLWYCAGASAEDMQLACKPCHKIKTHAERKGLSFEEARVDKEVIEWGKQSVSTQKAWLAKHLPDADASNKTKRLAAYRSTL